MTNLWCREHQEPENPRRYQCKGGRAFPDVSHRTVKESTQLSYRNGEKEDMQGCALTSDRSTGSL